MTKEQHFMGSISELEAAIKKPASGLFFVATRYLEHLGAIDRLLHECVNKGCYSQLKRLLDEVEKEEVPFSKIQVFLACLMPVYEFLHEVSPTRTNLRLDASFRTQIGYQLVAKDSISRKDIDAGLQYYRDFAGEFEKQVRVIVGLLEILARGVKPEYRKIKRRTLATNLEEPEKSEEYRGLAVPFSRTVRNVLTHSGYAIDPIGEKVGFLDRRDSVTLTFVEFLRKLADLSGLVLALLSLRFNLMLLRFRQIRDTYHQAKREQ